MLGLDVLNIDILKTYVNKSSLIHNYCSLIDIQNVRDTTDNTKNENITKALIIIRLLNSLGYCNMFDSKQIIDVDFDTKIEELKNGLFKTEQVDIKRLFGMTKLQQKLDTRKATLGFINTLLKVFNIQISSVRKHLTDGYKYYFFIEHLSHIKEILTYKIEKGFKIFNSENIFKPFIHNFELQDYYVKPIVKTYDDDTVIKNIDFGLDLEIE